MSIMQISPQAGNSSDGTSVLAEGDAASEAPSQRLDLSAHPWTLREKFRRALWLLAWAVLGYWGPRSFSPLRVLLLRMFGSKIGSGCKICGHVKVLMPWNLEIGDFSVIAERVDVYNFGRVSIGRQTCISQGVWLCTGTHDHRKRDFPLYWLPIVIGHSVWIAAEALVLPGTMIENGAVVGARSVVSGKLAEWTVYSGNPAQPRGVRKIAEAE